VFGRSKLCIRGAGQRDGERLIVFRGAIADHRNPNLPGRCARGDDNTGARSDSGNPGWHQYWSQFPEWSCK
jgi:hypothetical protein